LVDSEFTGESSFVLPLHFATFARGLAKSSTASGALQGAQRRVFVRFSLSDLIVNQRAITILADVGNLGLPAGVDGLAGLTFLRFFDRWGAERRAEGWKFFLEKSVGETAV
jgi:hypothetical protein